MERTNLFILIGAGVLVIIIAVIVGNAFFGTKKSPEVAGEVTIWGFRDDEAAWDPVIIRFRELNPKVTVTYQRLPEATYEETLVNRLAEGRGPDIFFLWNSWVPKHRDKIYPSPSGFGPSTREFETAFVDGVSEELISPNGAILGMPLFIDTPALFYNKDIFNASGIVNPPATWEDMETLAKTLTRTTPAGDVARSGLALGTNQNIANAFEILSSLMLQYGDTLIPYFGGEPGFGEAAARALAFYTSFASITSQNFSWTNRLPSSLDALAEEKTVMAIGFADDMERVRSKNPHLALGVAPTPQVKNTTRFAVYGRYFFPTVSRQSQNPGAAWQFLVFAASPEGASLYLQGMNRAPARRDLIAAGAPSNDLEPFYRQALFARGWAVPDEKITRRLFGEAIDTVLSRAGDPESAVRRIGEQLKVIAR